MKKQLTILCLLLGAVSISFATVRTVSNHPSGGSQYSSLYDAYVASSANDTLIIEGTNINYNNQFGYLVPWDKKLVVIGAGYNPQVPGAKRVKFTATQNRSELRMGSGAAGSKFYGIEFLNGVMWDGGVISNIVFEECKFNSAFNLTSTTSTSGIFVINCVFDQDNADNIILPSGTTPTSIVVLNSVFDGIFQGNNNTVASTLIDHCIFLRPNCTIVNTNGATISNCIFANTCITSSGGANTFNNNLAPAGTVFPPSGNVGLGNLTGTISFTTFTGTYYSISHDYDLTADPGLSDATDGTDIGVHGGSTFFSENGEPLIVPVIRSLNILNMTVTPGGTLNITVTATNPGMD